jgi:hypothetical protein
MELRYACLVAGLKSSFFPPTPDRVNSGYYRRLEQGWKLGPV